MTEAEQEILDSLQRQYEALHEKLPTILGLSSGCSASQKTQFADTVNQALLNLVNAQNFLLGKEEALIQKISADVQKSEQQLTASLSSLANMAHCVDQITDAVKGVATVLKACAP